MRAAKMLLFLASARRALRKHRSDADRIISKLEAYAANPTAFLKVMTIQGYSAKRLRVGDLRVIFEETADAIIVTDMGPRGSIYEVG